jgi:hypothetical protein
LLAAAGAPRTASHQDKPATLTRAQQSFTQIYKRFAFLELLSHAGTRNAVATQFHGQLATMDREQFANANESVQDFFKHGGFHETELARRLHGVHAVHQVAE